MSYLWSFSSILVFFYRLWRFRGNQGKGGDIVFSSLPLPPTYEHSDFWPPVLYLRKLTFLITGHIINRLLLDETYQPLWISIWLTVNIINLFIYFVLDLITEGLFKLALTITLVLRVNRIVRWDIHSIWMNEWIKYPFPIYVVQNSKIKFFNFRKWVLNNWCRKCLETENWLTTSDTLTRRCSGKRMFYKISQNSQKSNGARVPFLKNWTVAFL